MASKGKNLLITILIILVLIVVSEIYAVSMGLLWYSVVDVISYAWDKLWWLFIICIVGISINGFKSTKRE